MRSIPFTIELLIQFLKRRIKKAHLSKGWAILSNGVRLRSVLWVSLSTSLLVDPSESKTAREAKRQNLHTRRKVLPIGKTHTPAKSQSASLQSQIQ